MRVKPEKDINATESEKKLSFFPFSIKSSYHIIIWKPPKKEIKAIVTKKKPLCHCHQYGSQE